MSQTTSPTADSKTQTLAQIGLAVVGIGVLAFRFPDLARTIVAFIIILSILIFVHEWGHFQFARWSGMKVNRFAIGFPPFIYTKKVKGINYSIGALPIGGMVDIAGLGSEEEMVREVESKVKVQDLLDRSNIGEKADTSEARERIYRDRSRPFGERQFQDGSLFARFMVLFAGPLMNFVFAILLAIALFSFVGKGNYDKAHFNRVGMVMGGSAAAKGGILVGDDIVAANGIHTTDLDKIKEIIRKYGMKPVTIDIRRDNVLIHKTVVPELKDQPTIDGKTERIPTIGIAFTYDPKTVTYEKVGVVEAVKLSFSGAYGMVAQIVDTVKRALTFKLTEMERNGIGGPVKIAQTVGQVAKDGDIRPLLELTAALSINLGFMNLLPLPALDGGRILFLGYELIMRRPIDPRKEGLVHAAGMVLLLAFMLFITLRDVISL